MGVGIEGGKKKWAAKQPLFGETWVRMRPTFKPHYESGMNAIAPAGKRVAPDKVKAYSEGVDAVTASDIAKKTAGKEDKWEDNYIAKMFV